MTAYKNFIHIDDVIQLIDNITHGIAIYQDSKKMLCKNDLFNNQVNCKEIILSSGLIVRINEQKAKEKSSLKDIDPNTGVIFIDIDDFKKVNDTIGHIQADHFLQNIYHSISNNIRESDTLIRFGGDEFIVLVKNYIDIENIAERLKKIIPINVSIGIAIPPAQNIMELIERADNNMYQEKRTKHKSINQ